MAPSEIWISMQSLLACCVGVFVIRGQHRHRYARHACVAAQIKYSLKSKGIT
jgi:hypothetical protein